MNYLIKTKINSCNVKIESVEMKTNAENQNANVQILERNCTGNQYPVRQNSVYKRSRLNFLTVCFIFASHPRKVNILNSDQRRKCPCAARRFRADPKRCLLHSVAVVSSVAVCSSHLSTNRMRFYFFQSKCVVIVSSPFDFLSRGGL